MQSLSVTSYILLGKSRLVITVEAECLAKGSGNRTITINNAMGGSHSQEEYYDYYFKKIEKKKCYEKDF